MLFLVGFAGIKRDSVGFREDTAPVSGMSPAPDPRLSRSRLSRSRLKGRERMNGDRERDG